MKVLLQIIALISFFSFCVIQLLPLEIFVGATLPEKRMDQYGAQILLAVIFFGSQALSRIEALHEKIDKK